MEYSIEIIKGCSRFVSMNNRLNLPSLGSILLVEALFCPLLSERGKTIDNLNNEYYHAMSTA